MIINLRIRKYIIHTAQLTSKEAGTRDEACRAALNLASQCSDHEIVGKLTKHLFAVLNGKAASFLHL